MERSPQPSPEDKRVKELSLVALRRRIQNTRISSIDVTAELSRLHIDDPETDVIIRTLVERVYPGRFDMEEKEKMTKMLIAAFKLRDSDESKEQEQHLMEMLAELDGLIDNGY